MKNILKPVILAILLVVPVLVYTFLKLFGENRYDIPVYYQSGLRDGIECGSGGNQLAALSDRLVTPDKIAIFSFLPAGCDEKCQVKRNQLSRVVNYFSPADVVVFSVIYPAVSDSVPGQLPDVEQDIVNWQLIETRGETVEDLVVCGLGMAWEPSSLDNFVLVDREQRVRGYYMGNDMEEVDRLIVELRILIDNYKDTGHGKNNS